GLVLALAGCGQSSSTSRKQVSAYITEVKHVETALTPPLTTVTRISAQVTAKGGKNLLGRTPLTSAKRQLKVALAQIDVQEQRLRALPAPASAANLRSLVLRLTSDQAALTHQLALLVAFLPRFNATVAPLQPALIRLEKVLSERQASGTAAVTALYTAKAQALRRFESTTDQITGRLRPLSPPLVSKPAYDAQLTSLRGMGTSAGKLASALAGGHPGDVRPLLIDFDKAALATHTKAVQRQQIAAIRRYDARSRQLTILAEDISRERLRLSNTLK
ncbi:MAG: hypothetical protein WAK93_17005, partial [Solirubrobacteraceae bacterium]